MLRTVSLLFCLAVLPACAQPRRLGLELKGGGLPGGWFTDVGGREHSTDYSWRATVGPAFQVHLTDRVAVEVAGLYRRIRRDAGGGYSIVPFSDTETGSGWEFPIVGKVFVGPAAGGFRPFVAAGPSIRRLRTSTDSMWTELVPQGSSFTTVTRTGTRTSRSWNGGITAGGGLERLLGAMRVTLDARYTRWIDAGQPTQTGCFIRCVSPNQFQFLLGAGF